MSEAIWVHSSFALPEQPKAAAGLWFTTGRLGLGLCKGKGPFLVSLRANTSLCMPRPAGVESGQKEPKVVYQTLTPRLICKLLTEDSQHPLFSVSSHLSHCRGS